MATGASMSAHLVSPSTPEIIPLQLLTNNFDLISGKMYYYNCKTEISQWEKPKEWVDRER